MSCNCEDRPVKKTEIDFFWPCMLVLFVLTYGDPDLFDALIHYLMAARP